MARATRGQSRKEMQLDWQFAEVSALAQSAGTIAALTFSFATALTILRLRGWFHCWIDGAQAPGGIVSLQYGLIHRRSGAASTAVADPRSDAETRWLWYGTSLLAYEEYVTDVIDCPGITFHRVPVDNKSMMKMKTGDELQFVVINTTIGSALSTNSVLQIRGLFGT